MRNDSFNHLRWLKANGHDLGPLTGTDAKALAAIAASWQLYAYSGSWSVIVAISFLVRQMQRSTRHLACELIAWAMDWGDRERLWPKVEACLASLDDEAIERVKAAMEPRS